MRRRRPATLGILSMIGCSSISARSNIGPSGSSRIFTGTTHLWNQVISRKSVWFMHLPLSTDSVCHDFRALRLWMPRPLSSSRVRASSEKGPLLIDKAFVLAITYHYPYAENKNLFELVFCCLIDVAVSIRPYGSTSKLRVAPGGISGRRATIAADCIGGGSIVGLIRNTNRRLSTNSPGTPRTIH